ncbi:TPA: hypothetical protein ACIBXN_005048, partial [Salmonella enterica subsp. diarizonae serovar 48:i:z]
ERKINTFKISKQNTPYCFIKILTVKATICRGEISIDETEPPDHGKRKLTAVRTGIKTLMCPWCKPSAPGKSKTWVLFGRTSHGNLAGEILYRMVEQGKKSFRWRVPKGNPYLREEVRNTYTSQYQEVVMALAIV